MPIRASCCIPKIQKGIKRAKEGSCPSLLYNLFHELRGADEINIATYLFNNPIYFEFLSELAKEGCKVNVTSIPMLGYSDKALKVEGFEEKVSGRHIAKIVYQGLQDTSNMRLRIFPHKYVWYGALYMGGGASYSFHVKAIYAKFPNNKNKCILSSGNFMFSDPYHSDNFIVFENMQSYENPFKRFFRDLEKFSIPYDQYNLQFKTLEDEFLYSFFGKEIEIDSSEHINCFFTAPFYFYENIGSNHFAGNRIIDLINNAQQRVWVCSQHFHDLISFDPERETIIKALYEKFLSNPDINFRFLKQVPHSSLADKRRAGIAETLFQFVLKADQRFNRLAHDKFMLIDGILLISTANYTSTQFAFGSRRMTAGKGKDRIVKQDYFSEVNGFAIIPNCPKEIMAIYENHFENLWQKGEEINIKL